MVKAFKNYGFARDAWMFLVAPAWYRGLVRVGSLKSVGGYGRSNHQQPQLMAAPVRPGSLVYAQYVSGGLGWRVKRGIERR